MDEVRIKYTTNRAVIDKTVIGEWRHEYNHSQNGNRRAGLGKSGALWQLSEKVYKVYQYVVCLTPLSCLSIKLSTSHHITELFIYRARYLTPHH